MTTKCTLGTLLWSISGWLAVCSGETMPLRLVIVLLQDAECHFVMLHYASLPLCSTEIYAERQPLVTNHSFDFVWYKVLVTSNFAIGKFPTCKKTTRWEPARFAIEWISIYYRNTWFQTGQQNAHWEPVYFVIRWISMYYEITWFQTGQQNAYWEPLFCGM